MFERGGGRNTIIAIERSGHSGRGRAIVDLDVWSQSNRLMVRSISSISLFDKDTNNFDETIDQVLQKYGNHSDSDLKRVV